MFNIKRKRIRYFAPWAIIRKPFVSEKHYIDPNGAICYDVKPGLEYANHVEMAGFYCSAIISYGAKADGSLRIMRHAVFPTLRNYPNNTHSSLDCNFQGVIVDTKNAGIEKAERFVFDGMLNIYSSINDLKIKRTIFPARSTKALIEIVELENTGLYNKEVNIINSDGSKITHAIYGHRRQRYVYEGRTDISNLILPPRGKHTVYAFYYACKEGESVNPDCQKELSLRLDFIKNLDNMLNVRTPDEKINLMIRYAKIRAAESIFMTKSGLMHSPGGGGYYAALWTNDQCEYVNPLFGYLGYPEGIEQSFNCYTLYKEYISANKALITSIIAEGDGVWHGAGDRGDSAMYAYGASRFLMELGDKNIAADYIKAIEDCLTYTLSRIAPEGIVASDSDELENRFLSGSANLSTSCIAYDALLSAAYLEEGLGFKIKANEYRAAAAKLSGSIEKYFGANVEGYDTYRYCKEERNLRSWIALPLTVGLNGRSHETMKALLSDKLRLREGLVTRSGEKTFWDRSTLYALRGLFSAGFAEESYSLLKEYTRSRLLGEHIPYAVEAFPEGNQAQLSAESGLYVRIFIEGILGYRPTGFNKFTLTPNLPSEWNSMAVTNMSVAGKKIDIEVIREGKEYLINITSNGGKGSVESGMEITV